MPHALDYLCRGTRVRKLQTSSCISLALIAPAALQRPYRELGHLVGAVSGALRSLLQTETGADCSGSVVTVGGR